jgi:hypothetical protein
VLRGEPPGPWGLLAGICKGARADSSAERLRAIVAIRDNRHTVTGEE